MTSFRPRAKATSIHLGHKRTCLQAHMPNVQGRFPDACSMFFVGLALGGIGFGALSDCKGRHISMYASTLMAMLCALLCALSSSYAMYCVFRVLGGAAAQG